MAEDRAGAAGGEGPEGAPGFLPADEFARIRRSVPLVCVDLLGFRRTGSEPEVLLIERRQRSDLTGWALVGGRVMLDESIAAAAARHLRETLGDRVTARARPWDRPDAVAEYRRGAEGGEAGTFDPDRHSVALNYCVELEGEPRAGGEALGLRWFGVSALPAPEQVVFGQSDLMGRLAASIPA